MKKKYCWAALLVAAFLAGCGGSSDPVAVNTPPAAVDVTPPITPPVEDDTPTKAVILNVADFGAKGDGVTDDTAAIQSALDAASVAKGTVVFSVGANSTGLESTADSVPVTTRTFMTGALFIKSNTTVQIDEFVVLKAIQAPTWWDLKTLISSGFSDGISAAAKKLYPQINTRVQGDEMSWVAAIINIHEQSNVTVKGKGTVEGNGSSWWTHYYGEGTTNHSSLGVTWALNWDEQRPRIIESFKSTDVTIKDLTFQNSPFWTVHVGYSDRVHIDGVKVYNFLTPEFPKMPSTDGIDLDSSSNVLVENCDIVANDDGFVIKSGRDGDGIRVNKPTENVVIRNSVVRAGATAFTIGSETSGGARNIEVYNVNVKPLIGLVDSNTGYKKNGPALYSVFVFKSAPTRGGVMENVYIHDMVVDNANLFMQGSMAWPSGGTSPAAFGTTYLKPGYWDAILAMPAVESDGYPLFRNFRIENIAVNNLEGSVFSVAGVTLAGETEKGMYTNFNFKNVNIKAVKKAGTSASAGSIANARDWTFTNSTIVNAAGANIVPSKNASTTSNLTGLAGW